MESRPVFGLHEIATERQVQEIPTENEEGKVLVRHDRHGYSFSFAGCGFLGSYHLGVAAVLISNVPHLLENAKYAGASAGALIAATILLDLPLEKVAMMVADAVATTRKYTLGAFDPDFMIGDKIREGIEEIMPEDAHIRCSGRLFICCTKIGITGRKPVVFSQFPTRQDLVEKLLNSSHIPVFCGTDLDTTFGSVLMDGGFSDNIPNIDENTIRVCPWAGAEDICPSDRDYGDKIPTRRFLNTQMDPSMANAGRFLAAFFLDSGEELRQHCLQGMEDAYRFLVQNDMIRCPDHQDYSHFQLRHIDTQKECLSCWEARNLEPELKVKPEYIEAFNEFIRHPEPEPAVRWYHTFFNLPLILTMMASFMFSIKSSGSFMYKALVGVLAILFEYHRSCRRLRQWKKGAQDSLPSIVFAPFRQTWRFSGRVGLLLLIKIAAGVCYILKIVYIIPIVHWLVSYVRRIVSQRAKKHRNKGRGLKNPKDFKLCECDDWTCTKPHRFNVCDCSDPNCAKIHCVGSKSRSPSMIHLPSMNCDSSKSRARTLSMPCLRRVGSTQSVSSM